MSKNGKSNWFTTGKIVLLVLFLAFNGLKIWMDGWKAWGINFIDYASGATGIAMVILVVGIFFGEYLIGWIKKVF